MKKVMAVVFTLALLTTMGSSLVSAQTPYVAVYFDQTLTEESRIYPGGCPGLGTLDTLYVAAVNFNSFFQGIEYSINYGNNVAWIADMGTPPVTIGVSPTGISMAWPVPQNGFFAVVVQQVFIQWICTDCQFQNDPIVVNPAPFNPNGRIEATRWPDLVLLPGIGLTALTCPTIAAEETTWGQVKALYE